MSMDLSILSTFNRYFTREYGLQETTVRAHVYIPWCVSRTEILKSVSCRKHEIVIGYTLFLFIMSNYSRKDWAICYNSHFDN